MPFDIGEAKQRRVAVIYKKADGSPGTVEGVPAWALSDIALATLTPAADGMEAFINHNGATGSVTLTVTADGDLGPAVFPVVVTEVFNMLAPLGATSGTLATADEVPIPP